MSDIKRKLELVAELEELVEKNPTYFDTGIKGLTPLELVYLKLTEGLMLHLFEQVGLEVVLAPGPILDAGDGEN